MVSIPSPERLYQTADGRVVREGHPDAARLYVAKGRKVPVSVLDGLDDLPEAVELPAGGKTIRFGGQETPEPVSEPEPAPPPAESAENVCDVCGFEAKTAAGLGAHQRSHQE